jgi:hypothetical protein
MSDFLDWPMPRQYAVIHEICSILEKHHIPYVCNKMNRPARSLTLMAPGCDAQALMAVYVEQDKIIDELRTELFKLRGMVKNEWKSEEYTAKGLLHSTERN